MASTCQRCGTKLGLLKRLSGVKICPDCEELERKRREEATGEYVQLLTKLWKGEILAEDATRGLTAIRGQGYLTGEVQEAMIAAAFRQFCDEVLRDDILTSGEEERLLAVAEVMQITQEKLETEFRDVLSRLVVARVNDGRLPVLQNAKILLKKGEVAHASMAAKLMKESVIREYHGGYSGFSLRVAKGVRFSTGGVKGRGVVVGTELKPEDEGLLTVTSQRVVFTGARKTVEIPLPKLVTLDIYKDGIRLHSTNRKHAVLLSLESGEVIGAIVNATIQKRV